MKDSQSSEAPSPSYVRKFAGDFTWHQTLQQEYKADPNAGWQGVRRTELAGDSERLPFHVRYFEIEPGGYSSLEKHEHQHVVTVLRGRGTVTLGSHVRDIGFGDVVYVAPMEVHQFANSTADEPLGFLCLVAAERDRPIVLNGQGSACELE